MIRKELNIEGMSCNHCVMALKKELSTLELTVEEIEVGKTVISYDENKVSETNIKTAVKEAGFVLKD